MSEAPLLSCSGTKLCVDALLCQLKKFNAGKQELRHVQGLRAGIGEVLLSYTPDLLVIGEKISY